MDGDNSKEKGFTSLSAVDEVRTTSSSRVESRQRNLQDFLLLWVNDSVDISTDNSQDLLAQLRNVSNDIYIFTNWDEAIDFLRGSHTMKALLVSKSTGNQHTIPLIHDIPHLHAIYIFSTNQSLDEQWTKEWIKIKGVYMDIQSICKTLRMTMKLFNQNSIAMSFVTIDEGIADANINQLEPSFMYTQIFKDIFLEIEYNEQSVKNFVEFWRLHYINNTAKLNDIAEFEHSYSPKSSIRWYTREYFVYQMLNRALRMLEADIIIDMGFFIRDLHQQIKELYQKQVDSYYGKQFFVYRGQGLSKTDFDKLLKTEGGLISFNNFLSTSTDETVPRIFAHDASINTDMIGIFFRISIDPSVPSTPFASIREVSHYQTEEEILFSMHSIFRIGEITKMDDSNLLFQVNLQLTADSDQDLRVLTDRIRKEVDDETGWRQLGLLLLKIGNFGKSEELYNTLLEQTSDENEKATYYNNLGFVKRGQGDYKNSLNYYEKGLNIFERTRPSNHPDLAISYGSIGGVYNCVGEYSDALLFYEKTLRIQEKTLSSLDPDLATSYNNIAGIYMNMGDYPKALSFHKKALQIREKSLPTNHPDCAQSYSNIGEAYLNIGEFTHALSFCEKALRIQQKALPPNHFTFATSYNNIGGVYDNMGDYSKALSFYGKTLEMQQQNLPPNHPFIANTYRSIAGLYRQIGDYSKALSSYEKSLEIEQNIFPLNHSLLATIYGGIAAVYMSMEDYSKAISFFQKTLEIQENVLSLNHPYLAATYSNMGLTYNYMGEYSKALPCCEKALEIQQITLPPDHPSMAAAYGNTAGVYMKLEDYPKALTLYEKSIEIQAKTLPPNHPLFGIAYNNVGVLYRNMKEYSKALSYLERGLNIFQSSLPPNHPNIGIAQKHIGELKTHL